MSSWYITLDYIQQLDFSNLLDLNLKFLVILQSSGVEHQLKSSAFLHAEFEPGRIYSTLITFLRYKKNCCPSEKQYGRRTLQGRNYIGSGIEQCLQEERCFLAAAVTRLHKPYSWEMTRIAVIHHLVVVSQAGHFPQDSSDEPCSIACLQR